MIIRAHAWNNRVHIGSWNYIRLERALHALGWNFEGGAGTFTKGWSGDPDDVTTTSLDRGNITYIIGTYCDKCRSVVSMCNMRSHHVCLC